MQWGSRLKPKLDGVVVVLLEVVGDGPGALVVDHRVAGDLEHAQQPVEHLRHCAYEIRDSADERRHHERVDLIRRKVHIVAKQEEVVDHIVALDQQQVIHGRVCSRSDKVDVPDQVDDVLGHVKTCFSEKNREDKNS